MCLNESAYKRSQWKNQCNTGLVTAWSSRLWPSLCTLQCTVPHLILYFFLKYCFNFCAPFLPLPQPQLRVRRQRVILNTALKLEQDSVVIAILNTMARRKTAFLLYRSPDLRWSLLPITSNFNQFLSCHTSSYALSSVCVYGTVRNRSFQWPQHCHLQHICSITAN